MSFRLVSRMGVSSRIRSIIVIFEKGYLRKNYLAKLLFPFFVYFLTSPAMIAQTIDDRIEDSKFYWGYGAQTITVRSVDSTTTSKNGNLLVGYRINKYLAVEGENSIAFSPHKEPFAGAVSTVSHNYFGNFLKVIIPLPAQSFAPFVRFGLVRGTTNTSVPYYGISGSLEDEALFFGVGGEWKTRSIGMLRFDIGRANFESGGVSGAATMISARSVYSF